MRTVKHAVGDRYGRLTVLERVPGSIKKQVMLRCMCDCGTETTVSSANLGRSSHSCGCLRFDTKPQATHGMHGTTEYNIWKSMRQRCLSPSCQAYPDYGGRGIAICDRWLASFDSFYADVGPRPSKAHSLDRIDNDKGYSPENCRWATSKEQANNRRPQVRLRHASKPFAGNYDASLLNDILGFGA